MILKFLLSLYLVYIRVFYTLNDIDYSEGNTIHIVNGGRNHFEPVLRKREIQHVRQRSSDCSKNKQSDNKPHQPRIVEQQPAPPENRVERADSDLNQQGTSDQLSDNHHSESVQKSENVRGRTGLLTSYHGVYYQVQWLMVVAL